MSHYDISTCKYNTCPRCKLYSILEEKVIQEEDGDIHNHFQCDNCNLCYYGDDLEIFSLILEKKLIKEGNNDPDPDWHDGPTYAVVWQLKWYMKKNMCQSQKWPNGKAHFTNLPLLPFSITVEALKKLLVLA